MRTCDVVVIGAGPGGGSAALHSARAGLSTLILEADPEVGTPVHCGECLSELAVQNLGLEIPDHVKALDVKGIRVIFPDGTEKPYWNTFYQQITFNKLSAEDLIKYIESEFDTEMLGLINSKINERLDFLTRIADIGTKKEVKGFKRYDE